MNNINRSEPFFKGFLHAVFYSIGSLLAVDITSVGVLDWSVPGFMVIMVLASVLHFLFLLGLYSIVFPLLPGMHLNGNTNNCRNLLDRVIPLFVFPFAILFGWLWLNDCLNKFFTFVMLDFLFVTYIGLYVYIKNKCSINEQA